MKTRIDNIKIAGRYRKEFGSLETLAKSINELGLLHPPIIDSNYRLIDGERRIKAHMLLGLDEVEVRIVHVPNLLKAEYDANNEALPWTVSEKVAIGLAMEEAIKQAVGERRGRPKVDSGQSDLSLTGPTDAGDVYLEYEHWQLDNRHCDTGWDDWLEEHYPHLVAPEIPVILPEIKSGQEAREVAAKQAGFGSEKTYRDAKKVIDNAEPELIEAVDSGKIAVSTAAALIDTPAETQIYAAENPKEAPAIVHNHRAQGTGENEWYTPEQHIHSVRTVMGAIDLDPATSELANQKVQAETIFTQSENGLEQEWHGRVWLNPPYSQPAISQFSEKLASEWESGRIQSAIALTHNYTDTKWFHRLAKTCRAICFTKGRIGFQNPEGKTAAPTQGQAFFYFGDAPDQFAEEFSRHGFVVEVMK